MNTGNYNHLGKSFARYVSFNVLGMVGISCYILADTFFVAKGLGLNGLAALNLAIPIFSFIQGLGLMVAMGSATKYSILNAMDDEKKASKFFSQALLTTIGLAGIFVLVGIFFSTDISKLCGAKEKTLALTEVYLKTILCFTPMFCVNHLFTCFVRNDGNPKLAMYATLAGSFVNILFDYIFIFPCKLGMFGAALATGMSPLTSVLILMTHVVRGKNKFHFQKESFQFGILIETIQLGFSSFINELSSGVVIFVFNNIILMLAGNIGVAAYGVVTNIALVVTSLFTGIGQGVQPLISHYYGANEKENVKKVYQYGVITATCLSIVAYLIIVGLRYPLIAAFNKESSEELKTIANIGILIYFTGFLPSGFNVVSTFYMTASAQAAKGMMISMSRGLICIVFFALVLSKAFGMIGVWSSFACAELVTAAFVYLILRRERGKRI